MAQIINLRQARRKKAKAERETRAEQNRIHFGRSKAERERDQKLEQAAAKHLDGHKLDGGNDA